MENFIFLLSMLFNLRFKVQDALLRALYRSQQWLGRCVDLLGVGSIQAQNFIIFSYVQLADDFHDVLSAATLLPRSATDTLLATIDAIPQSEYRSYRDVQFHSRKPSTISQVSCQREPYVIPNICKLTLQLLLPEHCNPTTPSLV